MNVNINHSVQLKKKLNKDINIICESGIISVEDIRLFN